MKSSRIMSNNDYRKRRRDEDSDEDSEEEEEFTSKKFRSMDSPKKVASKRKRSEDEDSGEESEEEYVSSKRQRDMQQDMREGYDSEEEQIRLETLKFDELLKKAHNLSKIVSGSIDKQLYEKLADGINVRRFVQLLQHLEHTTDGLYGAYSYDDRYRNDSAKQYFIDYLQNYMDSISGDRHKTNSKTEVSLLNIIHSAITKINISIPKKRR